MNGKKGERVREREKRPGKREIKDVDRKRVKESNGNRERKKEEREKVREEEKVRVCKRGRKCEENKRNGGR